MICKVLRPSVFDALQPSVFYVWADNRDIDDLCSVGDNRSVMPSKHMSPAEIGSDGAESKHV